MGGVLDTAGWLAADPGGAAWAARLAGAQAAASLVIVAANLWIARVVFGLYRNRPSARPLPALVALSAVLIALCGLAHLASLFAADPAPGLTPAVIKAVSAAFWLSAAWRLPAVYDRLMTPVPIKDRPDAAADTARATEQLAREVRRFKAQSRALAELMRTDPRLRDKVETAREARFTPEGQEQESR